MELEYPSKSPTILQSMRVYILS